MPALRPLPATAACTLALAYPEREQLAIALAQSGMLQAAGRPEYAMPGEIDRYIAHVRGAWELLCSEPLLGVRCMSSQKRALADGIATLLRKESPREGVDATPDVLAVLRKVRDWADAECMSQGMKGDGPWELVDAAITKASAKHPTVPLAECAYGARVGQYLCQWVSRDGQSSVWMGVGDTPEDSEEDAERVWAAHGLPDADGRLIPHLVTA